jgi:hypothetical protein
MRGLADLVLTSKMVMQLGEQSFCQTVVYARLAAQGYGVSNSSAHRMLSSYVTARHPLNPAHLGKLAAAREPCITGIWMTLVLITRNRIELVVGRMKKRAAIGPGHAIVPATPRIFQSSLSP